MEIDRSINRQRCGHITTLGVHYFSNNLNGLESQCHIHTSRHQINYFKTFVMCRS